MDDQVLDLNSIQTWTNAKPAEKAKILRDLFEVEFSPLTPTQLALLSTYMTLDGYEIPQTTTAMLSVLAIFEEAGAIETTESDDGNLLVRIYNGSR